MIFHYSISTPANTAQSSPVKSTKELANGVLILKYILFPPGCAGLVGVKICDASHQIWPTNPEEWLVGDDLIRYDDREPFFEQPYRLDIYTYNEDDTNDHKPIICLGVERSEQWVEVTKTVQLSPQFLE
jgi:hypothetical protein